MLRVRTKKHLEFTRAGIRFTREWTEVDPSKIPPPRLDYLLASTDVFEFEGAPAAPPAVEPGTPEEAIAAAQEAGVSGPDVPPPSPPPAHSRRKR